MPEQSPTTTGPFISYSRKDSAFVRRLHEALIARGREPWVDWQGILPTEEWMAKIRAAIDAAPAFVFVISPHSVASAVCTQEIEHAVAQGKRLIPVAWTPVEATAVHPALAKLNWIAFAEGASLDQQVDTLISAMDLDLEWIRDHTRLLVRAAEWQHEGREPSLLLRGADLRDAELWLMSSGTDERRRATTAQVDFVAASRRDAARRQRQVLGATLGALVVTAVLAVLAWTQRNVAREQRDIALSRLLSNQATANLDNHLDLSLLLSAEAYRLSPTAEARATLITATQRQPRLLRYLKEQPAAVVSLVFDGTGERLAAGDVTHRTTVWEASTGRRLAELRGDAAHTRATSFSPTGRLVARGRRDGGLTVWDIESGQRQELLAAADLGPVSAVAIASDGQTLVVGHEGGVVRLASLNDARTICQFVPPATPGLPARVTEVWLGSNSRAISRHGGASYAWSLEDCRLSGGRIEDAGDSLVAAASSLDWMAGSSPGPGNLAVVRLDTGTLQKYEPRYDDFSTALAIGGTPNNPLVAIGTRDAHVVFWDLKAASQFPLRLDGHASEIQSVAIDPSGRFVASGALDGDVMLWWLDPSMSASEPAASGPKPAHLQYGGARLWGLTEDGELVEGSDQGPVVPAGLRAGDAPLGLEVSSDGRTAAVPLGSDGIVVIDLESRAIRRRVKATMDHDAAMALHPTSPLLAYARRASVVVWDTERDAEVRVLEGPERGVTDLVFSRDGSMLAIAGQDNNVRLWRTANWSLQTTIAGVNEKYVRSVAFSNDGRRLVAGGGMYDGTVTIWDVSTGRPITAPVRTDEVDVTRVVFSPDGSLAAASSFVGGAFVWDATTGGLLARLPAVNSGPGVASPIDFSPDGAVLAIASPTGLVRWPLDVDGWMRRACRIANRSLTMEEWLRHVGAETPYRATCGNELSRP